MEPVDIGHLGKMALSFPLGTTRCVPQEAFPLVLGFQISKTNTTYKLTGTLWHGSYLLRNGFEIQYKNYLFLNVS